MAACVESYTTPKMNGVVQFLEAEGDLSQNECHNQWVMIFLHKSA
jgi:hypothetical protein